MSSPVTSAPDASPVARAGGDGRHRTFAEVAGLTVVLGWGVNAPVVKAAIGDVPPILFTTSRFILGFLILLAILKWREGSVGLPRQLVLPMLVLGLTGFGLYQDLWVGALEYTTASNSSIITSSSSVWTVLIAAAIGADALSRRKVGGAFISFAGVVLVVGATHGLDLNGATLGDGVTFIGAVCWACYVAFGAPVVARLSPLRMTTWAVGFGILAMLPPAILQLASLEPSKLGPQTLAEFLYCAVIGTVYGSVLVAAVVKEIGPTRMASILFLVPAVAVVSSAIMLGEHIVIGQLIGAAVIVGGILVSRSGPHTYRTVNAEGRPGAIRA
jgi:drug/metabolite transporter (DMT)-like permease